MTNFFEEAKKYTDKLVEDRENLHQIPEVGLSLPRTSAYVKKSLEELGLSVKEYGESGLSTTIEGGKGPGKCLMIRADMDALPMKEESGLPFEAKGEAAHTCGHDLHAAIGLNAVRLLLSHKDEFKGTVKFMFQPAEEIFAGSKMMIENGILEDPKVDCAIGLHTNLDYGPGSISYGEGFVQTSSDNFRIEIKGKGGHGAYPHTTKDPINAGCEIYTAFNELISREVDPREVAILTFGQFSAGSSANIIPDTALLQGTLRCFKPEIRDYLKKRMGEICESVAGLTGCKVTLKYIGEAPSLYNNPDLTRQLVSYVKRDGEGLTLHPDTTLFASEDFAYVSQEVPTTYFFLNCKVEGNNASHHNPQVLFSEEALPIGLGLLTTCAVNRLNDN